MPTARREGQERDALPANAPHAGTDCSEPRMRSPEVVTGRRDGHLTETMNGENVKHLLQQAAQEIESLRRQNELLQAKVEVVNIFGVALLGPRPQSGMSPDVVWALRKEIQRLEDADPFKVTPVPM